MKLKCANSLVLLVILLWMTSYAYAQKRGRNIYDAKAWYIGAEGGANIFFGDVKYKDYLPSLKYNELTFGAGLQFGKFLSPKFLIKGNVHYSDLKGTKGTSSSLYSFNTKAQNASLSLQINLFQTFNNRPKLHKLSAWGEIGIGASRWQSLLYNYETGDTLSNLYWNSKQYEASLMVPLGLDIKYYLRNNISIDFLSSLVFVNSDFLDAKIGGIKFDYYWYSGLGINYHIGFNKRSLSTKVNPIRKSKGEIELLDYLSIDPFQDPEVKRITKKEYLEKEEQKAQLNNNSSTPYLIEFWVPQQANNKKFKVLVSVKKRGITGNGFFRLTLPSGFYPTPPSIKEVSYTRIDYNYDFDFYLPMNKDTLLIPIEINISEREDGTYPLFIEGEVMNQDGALFPIKNAQYVRIGGDVEYNDIPQELIKDQVLSDSVNTYRNPENVTETREETTVGKSYRIQILACRQPSKKVDEFLSKHQIDQKIYLYEKNSWWRYSIYQLNTMKEAEEFLLIVRNKHHLQDAFIVEFVNGERFVPTNQPARQATDGISYETSSYNLPQKTNLKKEISKPQEKNNIEELDKKQEQAMEEFEPVLDYDKISVYRIEIAVSPGYPIPIRQLQNWVAREKITEWTYNNDYRYTIGRFENEQVAQAFLKYVRLQFALPDSHLVETKGQNWVRVVR